MAAEEGDVSVSADVIHPAVVVSLQPMAAEEPAEQPAEESGDVQARSLGVRSSKHSSRNRDYIRNLMLNKKALQEQEALATQRSQMLQRKLARQVLGSSFDAITSRTWALPFVSASINRRQPADTEQPSDSAACASDGEAPHNRRGSNRLPSLPEGKAVKRPTGEGPDASSDRQDHTPVRGRWRRSTTSEAEGGNTWGEGAPVSPRAARSSGGGLARMTSLPANSAGKDTDGDKPSSHSPSKARQRDKASPGLPAVSTSGKDGLPPGASLYYQAKAQQDAQAQLMAKAYGGGATYAGYLQWRRRQKIPDNVKMFSMGGNGNHSSGIRAGLLARGWQEQEDHQSPYFDFKWSINPLDINQELLWPAQVVNHFSKATCITTKVGLCKTVRDLAWYEAADYLAFYPRGYDLGDDLDRAAWMEDARMCAAEAIVKRAAAEGGVRRSKHPSLPPSGASAPLVDLDTLRLALRVCVGRLAHDSFLRCERQLHPDQGSAGAQQAAMPQAEPRPAPKPVTLSAAEWQTIMKHPCLTYAPPVTSPPPFDESWLSRTFISSLHTAKPAGRRQRGKSSRCKTGRKGAKKGAAAVVDGADGEVAGGSSGVQGLGSSRSSPDTLLQGSQALPGSSRESDAQLDLRASWDTDSSGTAGRAASAGLVAGHRTQSRSTSSPLRPAEEGSSDSEEGGGKGHGSGDDDAGSEGDTNQSDTEATLDTADNRQGEIAVAGPDFDPSIMGRPDLPVLDVTDEQVAGMDALAALKLAGAVVEALEQWYMQTHINGMNNIWIVKPAGKSRGRGIRLFNDVDELMTYVKGEDALSLEWRWVAQKYIERPLVIQARKFDIRQWVLVTGWNPLSVWFYDTCYLRFAADDYSAADLDIYLHLSNNSIAKYYNNAKQDDITAQGNMWCVPQFKAWLMEQYGRPELWEEVIQPAMQHIVVCTTRCAADMVQARKNSCQIYGYDFLIDDQLRVWLLEVNSSPTMEPSTAITTELCADVQEDILKVVVDLPQARIAAAAAAGGAPLDLSAQDTGKWRCIVDTAAELQAPKYTGLNLELKGKSMATPVKKPQAVQPTLATIYAPHPGGEAGGAPDGGNPRQAAAPGNSPSRLVPSCYTQHQAQLTASRQALLGPAAAAGTAPPASQAATQKKAPNQSPNRLQRTPSMQEAATLLISHDVTPFGGATASRGGNTASLDQRQLLDSMNAGLQAAGNQGQGTPAPQGQQHLRPLQHMAESIAAPIRAALQSSQQLLNRPPSAFALTQHNREGAPSPLASLTQSAYTGSTPPGPTGRPVSSSTYSALLSRRSLEFSAPRSSNEVQPTEPQLERTSGRLAGSESLVRRSSLMSDMLPGGASAARGVADVAAASKGLSLISLSVAHRASVDATSLRASVPARCMTVLRPPVQGRAQSRRASTTNAESEQPATSSPQVKARASVNPATLQPQPGSWPVSGLAMVTDVSGGTRAGAAVPTAPAAQYMSQLSATDILAQVQAASAAATAVATAAASAAVRQAEEASGGPTPFLHVRSVGRLA